MTPARTSRGPEDVLADDALRVPACDDFSDAVGDLPGDGHHDIMVARARARLKPRRGRGQTETASAASVSEGWRRPRSRVAAGLTRTRPRAKTGTCVMAGL